MTRRSILIALAVAVLATMLPAGLALGGGPAIIRDSYTVTIHDDFIEELCGIDTVTTVTERWSLKEFADGSAILHVNRTFVPDDPRFPVEKGAGTSFIAADGSRTVVGKPTQLFEPGGGIRLLDAGRALFDASGNLVAVRGRSESLAAADLAVYYCP
jgi:hypothetical protein